MSGDADDKISKGCEYGRISRMIATEAKDDVISVKSKLDQIYTVLITTLFTVLGSTVVGVLIFFATRGKVSP